MADRYAAYLTSKHQLITPTIVLYEVYKKIKRERAEEEALLFAGRLSATQVVHLTESVAFLAADVSLRYGLAMTDAIVYATAKDQEAEVITGGCGSKGSVGGGLRQVSVHSNALFRNLVNEYSVSTVRDYGGDHQAVRNPEREGRRGTSAA